MLTLTKKTDYALIALTHLAKEPEGFISARRIAQRHNVPLPLLMNILKTLTQEGLVQSVRGPRGGYSLALPPDEITLCRLIEALERPVRFVRCAVSEDGDDPAPCELMSTCSVRTPAERIHSRLRQFLDDITVAELAGDSHAEDPAEGGGIELVAITGRGNRSDSTASA
jgi:Rrf2 family protein